MRSLNLDQLRALRTVTESRSFSAAARKLNLSQPAVSTQIRELERRFNVTLIERIGKQAHPTEPGRQLVEAAEEIFLACERAEQAMRRFREGWVGRVRLGSTLTAMIYRLPPILRRLRLEHPGLELVYSNMPSGDSIGCIAQNRLDLALVNLPAQHKQLKVTPLCSEMMVAIFSPSAGRLPKAITPAFVAEQPLLVEQTRSAAYGLVLDWAGREGPLAREPMALGTVETLKTAVASGLGMAIVPEVAVAAQVSDFVIRPLEPPLTRTLALIEHRHKPNEPAIEIVRNALLMLRGVPEAGKTKARGGRGVRPQQPVPRALS
jgi:DNA-binding transcriptional LysR family regulator